MRQALLERIKTFTAERTLFVILACLAAAFFFYGLAASAAAQAQTSQEDFGLTPGQDFGQVAISQGSDVKGTIARIINIVLGFLGVIAVGLIIYAGFLWMTAHGNEEQVSRAKLILRNALIGLVIILSAWGIASFVISKLLGATGGGSGDGDGGGGGGIGGGLPAERFTLQEFQTSHAGATNRDDVYRCSNIQSRFNHWLGSPLAAEARASIRAIQTKSSGQAVNLTLAMAVDSRNNVLHLERRNNEDTTKDDYWPAFSEVEIQVPKSLTDYEGKPLSDCTALGCNDNGDHYSWPFTTTDKIDTTPPGLSSAVPRLSNDAAGYPDRNVNRSVVFTVNFSEIIDWFSVTRTGGFLNPDRVWVEQIVSATDPTVVGAIPTEHWDAWETSTGFAFALNDTHRAAAGDGALLEPFTWYRVTVKDAEDLCGNPLLGGTVSWIFQTNGTVPGVAFTYPADQYQFACPSTETFVQFKTSMYDGKNGSCAVNPDIGGLVLGGSGFTNRRLAVRDDLPNPGEAVAIDYNNFCKRYDFTPQTAELPPNATYSPSLDYRNPANDSQTEQASWSFGVKPASGCANAPYISQVSPNEGPPGRCVTVSGNNFGPAASRGAGDAYLHPETGSELAFAINDNNWFETYLTGSVPAVPPGTEVRADFSADVARSVTLGGSEQLLRSNTLPFTVRLDEPAYQGPCLSSLTPASGNRDITVALLGTNFGASQEAVTFTDRTLAAAIANWTNSTIRAIVPPAAQDGLVHVETARGLSNGLPFDVAVGAGGECTAAADCAPGLACLGGICTDPANTRPTGFRIEDIWPAGGCGNTCTNAALGFAANFEINRNSLTRAVYQTLGRIGGSVAVLKCQDQNCATFTSQTSEEFNPVLGEDDKRVNLDMTLFPNTRYRVIVYGDAAGLRSESGANLVNNNYDSNNDGALDAYSWHFTTGANACALTRLEVDKPALSLYEGTSSDVEARGYSRIDSCNPATGQLLEADSLGRLNWFARAYVNGDIQNECSIDGVPPKVGGENILVINQSQNNRNVITAQAGTTSGEKALACVSTSDNGIKAGSSVTVYARCQTDQDCTNNGSACRGSACNRTGPNAGRCTPTIMDIYPPSGAVGTWVTATGCYFGNTPGTVRGANSEALFEIPLSMCGQYWTDQSIITEVPAGLQTSEPVKITKHESAGGESAVSRENFATDQTSHPALCRLEPSYGAVGSAVSLFGKNFGSRNPETDQAVFAATSTPESFPALDIKEWSDTASSAVIKLAAPLVSRLGDWLVRVVKGRPQSNPVKFIVTAGAAPTLITPPEPLLAESYMPGPRQAACPALLVEVILSGTLDFDSLADNFFVRRTGATAPLLGQAYAYDYGAGKTRLVFAPERTLALGTNYEIVLAGGSAGLQSQTGGSLMPSALCPAQPLMQNQECVIGFNTIGRQDQAALNQCAASGLALAPANPLYFCAGNNCPGDVDPAAGHQRHWFARLTARNGQPLNAASPFVWSTEDRTIIDLFGDTASARSTYAILPKNGETSIGVSTTVGGKTFSAATAARVFLCENPWPGYPRAPFRDEADNGFTAMRNWTNFSTFYCRDKGKAGLEEDLPAIPIGAAPDWQFTEIVGSADNKGQAHSLVPGLIKELFFTVPRADAKKTDAIGLRVLQNPEHDAVAKWYSLQSFNQGAPQAAAVDGYPALRDGRTVYVMAPNDSDGDGSATGNIYANIYLLSVSDNAQAATQDIFNQLLANWRFAVNVIEPDNRDALRRDAARLSDLRNMADIIEIAGPPALNSGSFMPGLSTSVWPSWTGALSGDLGQALPLDPRNSLSCAPGYDQATCFNKNLNPQWQCLSGNIYQYQYVSGPPPDFTLKANLEYQGASWSHPAGGRWRSGAGEQCVNTYYGK